MFKMSKKATAVYNGSDYVIRLNGGKADNPLFDICTARHRPVAYRLTEKQVERWFELLGEEMEEYEN